MLKLRIKLATKLYERIKDILNPELETLNGQHVNVIVWLDGILNT